MLGKSANARNEIKFLCIEELVPKDHLLRKIEKAVNFDKIYAIVKGYYSKTDGKQPCHQ